MIESGMVAMNSHNTFPYCTGLHGQLAQMAGLTEPDPTNPAVMYAKTFALESGHGPAVDLTYARLSKTIGSNMAKSTDALCWALLWGKTTGNTINNAQDKILNLKLSQATMLDVFALAYYSPLFGVIGLLNSVLTLAPSIPKTFSAGLGALIWVPQALTIFPLGFVSTVLSFLCLVGKLVQ